MCKKKKQTPVQEAPQKVEEKKNLLLDHFIQRKVADQMQQMDEKAIAMAIKSLLQEEQDNKTLH